MASESGPAEREQELGALRKRMRRAARRGDAAELEELSTLYAEAKSVHVVLSHEEHRAEVRARRAAVRAVEAQQGPERWRLPPGFSSPLAAERARTGWQERLEPVRPAYGLRPWRRYGGAVTEQIWRPGR